MILFDIFYLWTCLPCINAILANIIMIYANLFLSNTQILSILFYC